MFNNAYFTRSREPLSAREFRAAMLSGGEIQMHRLDPNVRPGYAHDYKAWDYYRRGLPEWYMWWGNNPFSYEQTLSVQHFSQLSRRPARLGAIVQGTHPRIHVLVTDENRARVNALSRVWVHVVSALASMALGVIIVSGVLIGRHWAQRRRVLAERKTGA